MRRLCRGLAVSLPIFFLFAGLFLLHTRSALAQAVTGATKIGTHLIQGDYSAQTDVIKKLVSSGAVSAGEKPYPIVVMVDPSNPSGLSVIKSAIGDTNFFVILRINVHADTTNDMGAVANAIKQYFPDKSSTAVVVGNEINNQNIAANTPDPTDVDGEWKSNNYSAYGSMFNTICGSLQGYPCGIAALDTVNVDYDVAKILPQILSTVNKSLISAVFANVYQTAGCGSYDTVRCGPGSGNWIQGKIKNGVPLFITEFGITTCGDYDCIQSFYEENNSVAAKAVVGFTRPPGDSTSATWVHTVPAICEYWEGGSLSVQKPTKCGGGGKRQTFVYPGIEDMAPDAAKMKSMAAGYTLMCGNQFKVQGAIENEDALGLAKVDCTKNPPDYRCVISGVFANIILDDTKTTIPLFRTQGSTAPDPDNPKRRFDDLEGFFGANYTKASLQQGGDTSDAFLAPLSNGVSRKLTSFTSTCTFTLQYLQTIKALCDGEEHRSGYTYNDKLDADTIALNTSKPRPTLPPGECALYSKIPGANSEYDTYKKIIDKMPGNFSCTNTAPEIASSTWYKAFSKIELTTPKGFKPAYLVHYIDRPESPQTALDKRVVWQAPGERDNKGSGDERNIRDRIKIVKVYVPAGVAEVESNEQAAFFPTFTGGLMQSIKALLPYQLQSDILATRAQVIKTIEQAMDGSTTGTIKCESCIDRQPDDPRVMIVKRINAGIASAGESSCNASDLIGQTATERVHTINPAGTLDPVSPAKITASATMVATKSDSDPKETIKTFLLLPEEYRNIIDFETPFFQTFVPFDLQTKADGTEYEFVSTKTQLAAKPKASLKYLQLSGSATTVISRKVVGADLTYQVPGDNSPFLPPGQSPAPKNMTAQLSGEITVEDGTGEIHTDPQVPGGILTRALWEILCNVTRPYDSIPTVAFPGFEKFLQNGLSACTAGSTNPSTSPTTAQMAPGSCKYGDAAVDTAIQNAASKYKVPPEMLLAIYQTEGLDYRIAPEKYVCKENKGARAAGVTQVTPGTYGIVTCPDERVNNDLTTCQPPAAGKLSRCDVNGAFELAARVLLWKAGHWRYGICDGSERATEPIKNTNIREVFIAASYYYGSCNADKLTGNFSTGALRRGDILACRDKNCMSMGYGDFVCAFMAKQNKLDYCNRPDNFPSKADCRF